MHEQNINILSNSKQNKLELKPKNSHLKLYNNKEEDGDGAGDPNPDTLHFLRNCVPLNV